MDDPMVTGAIFGGLGAAVAILIMVFVRKPVKCAACGAEQPKFRKAANMNQAMWGGTTCKGCGAELDARGRVKVKKA